MRKLKTKDWWQALGVLAIGAMIYINQNGIYPRYFDIAWDEEVQLHDGRVIVVHVRRTFERLSGFNRWRGVHRNTEITFDAGGDLGRISRKFQRYDIDFLHNKNNDWYLALGVTTGTPPIELITWEKSVLVLWADGTQTSINKAELPSEFRYFNIMPVTPSIAGVAKFDGRKLSIAEKTEHWRANPIAAGDGPSMQIPTFK